MLFGEITFLWSLCMIIFEVTSSSAVIGLLTNQTSVDDSLVSATAKISDVLSSVVAYKYSGCRCGPLGDCAVDIFGKKSCVCYDGYVEIDGVCGLCDCGPFGECVWSDDGIQSCKCLLGYAEKDKKCTRCNCGFVGECLWDNKGRKTCQCPKGYGIKDGKCTKCSCYLDGVNDVDCTFRDGEQICSCPPGYEERISNICVDVSKCNEQSICPSNTKCINTEGGYRCVCNDGYKPFGEDYDPMQYGCTDINECFEQNECPFRDTTECVNTQGGYFCVCKTGYFSKFQGSLAENQGCQEDLSGWRIGYIILIIFFGFASFIIIMVIRNQRFSSPA